MIPLNLMQPTMPLLETPRLLIRPFAWSDLAAAHDLLDAPDSALSPRQRWLEWLVLNYENLAGLSQPPYGDRAIVLKHNDQLIGACGLVPALMPFDHLTGQPGPRYNSPEIGLFYELLPAQQGHGYATEAVQALIDYTFRALRLKRIVATTMYDNSRSIAMMKRLGLTLYHNPNPDPIWCQVVGILNNPYTEDNV